MSDILNPPPPLDPASPPPPPPSPPPPPPPPLGSARGPEIIPPSEGKDPVLVLVLALFFNGVAYFLIGQWQKGIAAIALWLCTLALIFFCVGIFLYIPLVAAVAIDAYMQAQALKDGHSIGQWTFFGNHY